MSPTVSLHDPEWTDAERAVWLLAVDPVGLGGVCVQGRDGPERQRLLDTARRAWPAGRPWQRLPLQIDDERLLGGVDLGLSLAAGRPVRQPGLLASSAGGLLVIGMAERMPPALAGKLAGMFDQGIAGSPSGRASTDPAEATTRTHAARCAVLALDEGAEADERPPPALLERLALQVTLDDGIDDIRMGVGTPAWPPPSTIGRPPPGDLAAASARLAQLPVDAGCIEAFCRAAEMLGVPSMRVPLQAWHAACAAAALAGHSQVGQDDAELAARLVIAPRARQRPAPSDSPEQAEPVAAQQASAPPESAPPPDVPPDVPETTTAPEAAAPPALDDRAPHEPQLSPERQPLPEQILAAAQAAIPAGLLRALAQGQTGPRARSSGRSGATAVSTDRGRPMPSRRGDLRGQARLDVLATLRAAVPWQRLRRPAQPDLPTRQRDNATGARAPGAEAAEANAARDALSARTHGAGVVAPNPPPRLIVRREDFHIRRCRQPQARTVIFVVDASGSQALHRLSEAKGAVELLLADCYVQRDRVALVAFRGAEAQVLLPPTRSLVRARRSLTSLPGGGGTPLAAGIAAADRLAAQVQREAGQSALVVLLTDARANVALDGLGGREQAMDDALRCARRLREHATPALLIDTAARPDTRSVRLAQAMAARHVVLPQAQAAAVHQAVNAAMRDRPAHRP